MKEEWAVRIREQMPKAIAAKVYAEFFLIGRCSSFLRVEFGEAAGADENDSL